MLISTYDLKLVTTLNTLFPKSEQEQTVEFTLGLYVTRIICMLY